MAKLTISEIVSSANPVPAINRAIQTLVSEFNNKVVYRANPIGENNTMSNDLDMGDNDILNAGLVSCSTLIVAGGTEVGEDGAAILDLVTTINELEDGVVALELADSAIEDRLDGLESDHTSYAGRLDNIESTNTTQNTRLTMLEGEMDSVESDVASLQVNRVLSTVNTANVHLTTTPVTITGDTDVFNGSGITRLGDGSIQYSYPGYYVVTFTFKVGTTSNIEVYFWVEKWNGSSWDNVPYSGIIRELPALREVEISASYLRSVQNADEIYRVRGSAASDNGAVLSADILPSGVTMPSIRLDIRGR